MQVALKFFLGLRGDDFAKIASAVIRCVTIDQTSPNSLFGV
jgi:hypothetical protein